MWPMCKVFPICAAEIVRLWQLPRTIAQRRHIFIALPHEQSHRTRHEAAARRGSYAKCIRINMLGSQLVVVVSATFCRVRMPTLRTTATNVLAAFCVCTLSAALSWENEEFSSLFIPSIGSHQRAEADEQTRRPDKRIVGGVDWPSVMTSGMRFCVGLHIHSSREYYILNAHKLVGQKKRFINCLQDLLVNVHASIIHVRRMATVKPSLAVPANPVA